MIWLHIKGGLETANQSLAARNITPVTIVERARGIWGSYTNAEVEPTYELAVQRWFCESPLQAPFPPGALLGYSVQKD